MPAKPLLKPALAAFLALTACAASAQVPGMPMFDSGLKSVALQLGVSRPTDTSGFSQTVKPGPAANIQFLYFPLDWVGVGAELTDFLLGKGTAKPGVKALSVVSRVNFLRERSWTPYALGGVGYHQFSYAYSGPATSTACDPLTGKCGQFPSASSSGLTVTAGAGLEAFLFQGLSVSFETRYHDFQLKRSKFTGDAETLTYLFGVRVWFGWR